MRVHLVAQGGKSGFSIAAGLKDRLLDEQYDRVDVAVAYATRQGLKALRRVLGAWPQVSRWVIGLDDAITQPAAIDDLIELVGAEVRLAQLSPARRFHPKLYRFWSSADALKSLLLIGSGNMTQNGLQVNGEAAVLLESENLADTRRMEAIWQELWDLGRPHKEFDLKKYKELHKRATERRKQASDEGIAPVEPTATAEVIAAIPLVQTREAEIALCVARIADSASNGICTLDMGRERIPKMIPLTATDYTPYPSQPNPRWEQIMRNIRSNANGGPNSTNFIARGYLEALPEAYRITNKGRAHLRGMGF